MSMFGGLKSAGELAHSVISKPSGGTKNPGGIAGGS